MNLEHEKKTTREIVDEYKELVMELSKYIGWLESKKGQTTMSNFVPQNANLTLSIPRYDSTLINLVRTLENSGKMNRNYPYIYRNQRIYDVDDEISLIHRATINDMDILFGILSKYIITGRVKARVWNEGVENGVYFESLNEWKKVGFSSKEDDNALWDEFNSIRQSFFKKRDEYYDSMQKVYDEKASRKEELIKKAKLILANSEFVDEEINQIKELRSAWKEIGFTGKERDDALYLEFNGTLNKYFDEMRKYR